jgi:anti-sigma-K factor RskA
MIEPEDIDALATEYVLGTLDAVERADVLRRRSSNPLLDAAIVDLEQRLWPLHAATVPVAPPPDLFKRIERRLTPAMAVSPLAAPSNAIVLELQARARRWRSTALATSAIAASLILTIGFRETVWRPSPQSFVAVFQKDDAQPAFILSIDLDSRELTIRQVTAEREPGKAYQLWILADKLGPVPQSLGLLHETLEPTRQRLNKFDPALLRSATFGISVEPPGGSPTGRPTGPAIHGRLIPAAPQL